MSDGRIPYVVEPMQMDDIEQVMAIERVSFPLPWSLNTYRHELLENMHSHYVVVRQDVPTVPTASLWARLFGGGQPRRALVLGYGGFWLVVDEAHISTIATATAWRRRGLGELLLLTMIERGLELGAQLVTLEVRVSNIIAQNLYRKYGFETIGRRKHYYRDNGEDAFIMSIEKVTSAEYAQKLQALRLALYARLRSASS